MERNSALTWLVVAAALTASPPVRAQGPDSAASDDRCEQEQGAGAEAPEAPWAPTTSGPFFVYTAALPPEGHLTLQPLLFWMRTRGEYSGSGAYSQFEQGTALSGFTGQLFMEYALPWRLSVGAQAAVVHNWASAAEKTAAATGFGDTLVFTRYALLEEPPVAPATTLLLVLKIPTARYQSAAPGKLGTDIVGTGTWDLGFGVNLTRPFGDAVVSHLDAVLALPGKVDVDGVETRRGWTFVWAAAIEIPLFGDRIAWEAELTGHHESDLLLDGVRQLDSQVNALTVGTGIEVIFSEAVQLLFGYQRTLWGTNVGAIDTLGLTLVPTL